MIPDDFDRQVSVLGGALVVCALLLGTSAVFGWVVAAREARELTITCRYARAGLTPRADSLLVSDTLRWCSTVASEAK